MANVSAASLRVLLGSMWRHIFDNQLQLDAFLAGRAEAENDGELTLQRAIDSVSRLTTPIMKRRQWHRLVLRESERNTAETASVTYGGEQVYGDGTVYGQTLNLTVSRFPLPTGLVTVPFALNRMTMPTLCWASGSDFTIDVENQYIEFAQNPFDEPLIAQRGLYADGGEVDRELELWLYRPDYDIDLFYRRWGYVLGIAGPSTANYGSTINAAWDSLVEGSSLTRMRQFIAAVTDVPIAADDDNTEVVAIFTDNDRLCIASESHVYFFHPDSTAVVAVGDQLEPYQELVSTTQLVRFGNGEVPDDVTGIVLDRQLFGQALFNGLQFVNASVAATVTVDEYGYTDWRFPVGGWPADVDWLFDSMQERGRDTDSTLAMLLDTRTNKVGQPTAGNLPTTVNPAEFVAQHVLRNNAVLLQIDTTRVGVNALPLSYLRRLPQMLAAHATVLLELTAEAVEDVFDHTQLEDEITPYQAAVVPDDVFDHTQLTDTLTARYIDGVCL